MSSTTNDATLTSEVLSQVQETIEIIDSYVLGVADIDRCIYEIVENQFNVYGTNKLGDKFLLYRANVTDLTEDTDLFTPISENIERSTKARQVSQNCQKVFRGFLEGFSGSSASSVVPALSLEHGLSADGNQLCHSVAVVGYLNCNGAKYKITFGKAIDFEHMKDCGAQMHGAINNIRKWCAGLTNDNLQERLATSVDGVKIIRTDGQTPVYASDDDDDHSQDMNVQDDDDMASLKLAMQLQAEEEENQRAAFNVFQQRKPMFSPKFSTSSSSYASQSSASSSSKKKAPIIKISAVKDEAVLNLRDAMELLQGIVMSTNPYKDRTADQVYQGIRVELVPQNLGKDNIFDRENAKKWSFKVSFDKCYWMIPILNEENELKTSDEILESLREIAYFGPEINDLLVHWVKRGVFLSTEFATDTVVGDDGKETTKRVCTMGMFKVDNLTCCPLADLSAMHEGDFKKRIDIPEDIYKLKPDQLIAGIQQNIHNFIDHMLEATECSQPHAAVRNDVQTMVEALHSKTLKSRLEELNAQLYWTFQTPKGNPNTLKLYIDIDDEAKRPQVYAVLREFMNAVDFNKSWSFKILSEAINTVREWGKGDAMAKDPVAPLCVQMTWKGDSDETITNILQFIDEYEQGHLREFGLTTRAVVQDGLNESVMVELHALSSEKLPGAINSIQNLLTEACMKFSGQNSKEAMLVQQLDSSVQTRGGYKVRRPNTLSFALRNVTGSIAQMVNFLRMHSGVRELRISMEEKFGGAKSLVLEYEAKDAAAKEKVIDGLDKVLTNAVQTLSDEFWIYENIKVPGNTVKYTVELPSSQGYSIGFGGGFSTGFGDGFSTGFGAVPSSGFGGFTPSFSRAPRVKPKPKQCDPGYGEKEITADTLTEIFDFSDDDL